MAATALEMVALIGLVGMSSGCASLLSADRRRFAGHVAESSAPIMKSYRACVQKDSTLNDDEKRMRLSLADEFDQYIQGGLK